MDNRLQFLFVIYLLGNGSICDSYAQVKAWNGFDKDSTVSALDGVVQYFYYYKSTESEKQPLVVSLHQWSSDYSTFVNSLAPETKAKNWNYIRPDFRGPNNHLKACGSEYVIADIDDAIDWAIKTLPVDTNEIYIVGASGGGYAALCHFMKSKYSVNTYSVWVPISDLKRWYAESKSRGLHYAADIVQCTCGDCSELNEELVKDRSPLYWETPIEKQDGTKLKIYAGIHDGFTGSVPIIHSILFFNKVVNDYGAPESNRVANDDMLWMLTTRSSPCETTNRIGDRNVHYYQSYKDVSLTIFEGGHEILVESVLENL